MNDYIKLFTRVIRNCRIDNTYKMAWGKALVEISTKNKGNQRIEFKEIAETIFKYYWNQTIYFDLIQGSNLSKPPEFITEIKNQINLYYKRNNTKKPIHFERVKDIELNYDKLIQILKQDVSWRFLKLENKIIPLYKYHKGNDFLILKEQSILSDYSDVLFEVINFRWTQILENFNSSPRIAKKVRILDFDTIKRNSLAKYKDYLDEYNKQRTCFICGNEIKNESPSIDHVIPWSFLFSDDLWNLVYTHQSCNSRKSNIIPTEEDITRLEKRNKELYKILTPKYETRKDVKELELAINKDYVKKFWINCKT